MSPTRRELQVLTRLALPVVGTQVAMMLMGIVDTLMVARVGVAELAAAALANSWAWSWTSLAMGIVLGMDPLVSQSHGAGDGPGTALALQRGLIASLMVSPFLVAAFACTGPGLLALGQDPEITGLAHQYMLIRAPAQPLFLVYVALRQYLQGRTLMKPAMWIMLIGNVLNFALNWVLIFGRLGFPALGLEGAALATALMQVAMPLGLWGCVVGFRLHEGAWRAWDRASFAWSGVRQLIALGIPVGLQMALEAWAFSLAAYMAGWLGVTEVASHTVALNMVALAFMVPLGISIGAAARVGNLIGAGDITGMRRSARVALALSASVMLSCAVVFCALRWRLPLLYTRDLRIVELVAWILPIAGVFQLFDGTQIVSGGILRGMGRPNAAAVVNLLGYFAIGLPLAYLLAFRLNAGLPGIWWGLAVALALVSTAMAFWLRRTAARPLQELRVGSVEASVLPEGLETS